MEADRNKKKNRRRSVRLLKSVSSVSEAEEEGMYGSVWLAESKDSEKLLSPCQSVTHPTDADCQSNQSSYLVCDNKLQYSHQSGSEKLMIVSGTKQDEQQISSESVYGNSQCSGESNASCIETLPSSMCSVSENKKLEPFCLNKSENFDSVENKSISEEVCPAHVLMDTSLLNSSWQQKSFLCADDSVPQNVACTPQTLNNSCGDQTSMTFTPVSERCDSEMDSEMSLDTAFFFQLDQSSHSLNKSDQLSLLESEKPPSKHATVSLGDLHWENKNLLDSVPNNLTLRSVENLTVPLSDCGMKTVKTRENVLLSGVSSHLVSPASATVTCCPVFGLSSNPTDKDSMKFQHTSNALNDANTEFESTSKILSDSNTECESTPKILSDNTEFESSSNAMNDSNTEFEPTSSALSDSNKELEPTSSASSDSNKEFDPTSNALSDSNKELEPTSNALSNSNKELEPTCNMLSDCDKVCSVLKGGDIEYQDSNQSQNKRSLLNESCSLTQTNKSQHDNVASMQDALIEAGAVDSTKTDVEHNSPLVTEHSLCSQSHTSVQCPSGAPSDTDSDTFLTANETPTSDVSVSKSSESLSNTFNTSANSTGKPPEAVIGDLNSTANSVEKLSQATGDDFETNLNAMTGTSMINSSEVISFGLDTSANCMSSEDIDTNANFSSEVAKYSFSANCEKVDVTISSSEEKKAEEKTAKTSKKMRRRSAFGSELRLKNFIQEDTSTQTPTQTESESPSLSQPVIVQSDSDSSHSLSSVAEKKEPTLADNRQENNLPPDGHKCVDVPLDTNTDTESQAQERKKVKSTAQKGRKRRQSADVSILATEMDVSSFQDSQDSGEDGKKHVFTKRRSSLRLYRRKSQSFEVANDEREKIEEEPSTDLPPSQQQNCLSQPSDVCQETEDSSSVPPELEQLYRNKNYKKPEHKTWETIFEAPSRGKVTSKQRLKRYIQFEDRVPMAKLKRRLKKATENGLDMNKFDLDRTDLDVAKKLEELDQEMLVD